ncbi:MAG: VanW family protein [Acidobacteriia bacterium]|nr:VanW family protein [Terriglobia bacterium]
MRPKQPTRASAIVFSAKAAALRALRGVRELKAPVRRFAPGNPSDYPLLLAECRTPLFTAESAVESGLQFGKVQNLRRACALLHRAEIPAGETFSFWKQIGRPTKSRGYVEGRELRQGCLIPSVGGGLCQLSNGLYDLALKTGCEIVERQAHTAVVPGSAAASGRDATIFWNYVDLRFRTSQDLLLTAILSKDELVLSLWGKRPLVEITTPTPEARLAQAVRTCTDCGVESCFRHVKPDQFRPAGNGAFLVEECWPEFEEFAARERVFGDELYLPFHSSMIRPARYHWATEGYAKVTAATLPTSLASVKERFGLDGDLSPIAAQVQRSQALARYYSRHLSSGISFLFVAQSLLPFVSRNGDLGGRGYSVLMTRLPLQTLHSRLDELAARFPDRPSLAEFRAPAWMVEAETEALERAESIITPHALLAGLYPQKTRLLEWKLPEATPSAPGDCIVFPGPALARKGAFELRKALSGSTRPLMVVNNETREYEKFWQGTSLARRDHSDWLQRAAVVVQPAFVEDSPRLLLRALAAGIPVIATPECGIADHPGLTLISAGDVGALKRALQRN